MHVLWSHAMQRVDVLRRRVEKGECLSEALDFCRFLYWSHTVDILREFDNGGSLPVDSELLRSNSAALQRMVQDRYARKDFTPITSDDTLTSIDRKLDLIAAELVRISRTPAEGVGPAIPALRVVPGVGADNDGKTAHAGA